MTRPTSHWCHGVSVSGSVDPSGCCADQPPTAATHGGLCWTGEAHEWESYARDDGDAWYVVERICKAGCRPTDPPTATTIAAGLRAEVDRAAADRLAKGLRGGRA